MAVKENEKIEQVNLNDRSKVKNLCDWAVSFERINSIGDEYFPPNGTIYISNMEIESQVQNGNVFFAGTDRNGSHARLLIDNPSMREYLGFDNKDENRKQLILDDDRCKEILDYKTFKVFKEHVENEVITNQEKSKIINYARKTKLNDYEKIQLLEQHCGIKF
jgi:hypothetical protein